MDGIITTLIIIGIIVLSIVIGVAVIRYKLNKVTQKYLGKNLSQVGEAIKEGLNDDSQPPRQISAMTSIHRPNFQRDFPETSYNQIESMARNGLTGFLSAIETENAGKLYLPSTNLSQQLQDRLYDNKSKGIPEHFDSVKIHKTALASYKNMSGTADAVFEIAFECYHYFRENEKLNAPNQLAVSVTLNCGRAVASGDNSAVYSHNCPNCGAPVIAVGGNKVCEYCGSGISELGTRVWLVDSIKFI